VNGPAGVMALVLAETVAGSCAFTWIGPLWHETRRSYFAIHGVILALLFAGPAWWAAASGQIDDDGRLAARLALVAFAVVALSAVLLLARAQTAGRIAGLASVPASIAALVAMAGTSRQSFDVALLQLVAGSAFLGTVYVGLFLGHWYLTDRKLGRGPIQRVTNATLAAACLEIAAVATGGFSGTASSQAFNPLLTAGALAPWIAIGMAGSTLLIAIIVKAALRGQRATAVQSATGFYYLAVVTAFTAEIAVKTRFLPG
jgi:hypothetical protein